MNEFVANLTTDQRAAMTVVLIKLAWTDQLYYGAWRRTLDTLVFASQLPGLKWVEVDVKEEWNSYDR
jgi:hypothetical protein